MDFIDNLKLVLYRDVDFEEIHELVSDELWNLDQRKAAILSLERADIFDKKAYVKEYPDVRVSTDRAIDHYVNHGIDEGRSFFLKIK